VTGGPSAAVAVAAHGLAGSRLDLPTDRLDELAWFDLVGRCTDGQLVGFLAAAVADGDLPATDGQAEELSVLERERAGLSRLVDQQVVTACSLLVASGIDHRVVDGPGVSRAYGASGLRTHNSAEVVVPARRLEEARHLLGASGLGPEGPPAVRAARVGFRASVLPPAWVGDDVGVDRTSPDETLEIGGRANAALSIDEQLVVAGVELAVDRFSPHWLVRVRDVATLVLTPDLDPARVRRVAEDWNVAEVVAEMIALVWQILELADKTELSVWALRLGGARAAGAAPRRRRTGEQPLVNTSPRADRSHRFFGRRPGPVADAPAPRRYR
jgi:hypothetical protein